MNLKNNIRQFRLLSGLTQEELAEKVGISVNYLSLLENKRREPSIDLLKSFSKELGVPVSILIAEFKSNPKDPLDVLIKELYDVAIGAKQSTK